MIRIFAIQVLIAACAGSLVTGKTERLAQDSRGFAAEKLGWF
jgi:hypothetical protein